MACRAPLRRPTISFTAHIARIAGCTHEAIQTRLLPAGSNVRYNQDQRRSISIAELDRLKGDRERVVVIGAGWGGFVLSRRLNPKKYQTVVVSPRSYFAFTPLLAGTCVGTLEYRNVIEPVRDRRLPSVQYMQAWGDGVDLSKKIVRVEENLVNEAQNIAKAVGRFKELVGEGKQDVNVRQGVKWDVPYDKLVVAVGCYAQTFGTKGVRENAFFLKDAGDARRIRTRLLECFEIANLPTVSDEMKHQLLHFAVVGGGPTGMEFSAELSDLVRSDMAKLYPHLKQYVKVTVYDVAPTILGAFDKNLGEYAAKVFRREGVSIKTSHHVEELRPGLPKTRDGIEVALKDSEGCYTIKTKEDGEHGIGLCVWSTGLAMNPFVENIVKELRDLPERSLMGSQRHESATGVQWRLRTHPKTNGLLVDDRLRVQLEKVSPAEKGPTEEETSSTTQLKDVFAIGDNASIEGFQLPATAQAANQQALWLSKRLNKNDFDKEGFTYRNLGVMAYIGGQKALFQRGDESGGFHLKGTAAWLMWRGAYVTMALSWRNKIVIPFYWLLNWIFGRDISRF